MTRIPVELIDLDNAAIARRPIAPSRMVRLECQVALDPESVRPIAVRAVGDRYQLLSGRRHLLAVISLGRHEIDAKITRARKCK